MGPMAMVPTPTLMEATEPMDTGTPMLTMVSTTARGLLRLSLRPRLRPTPGTPMVPTDWATPVTTDWATEPMATPMLPGPTTDMVWDTEDTALATGATTGDKFSALRSTKQKLNANITPFYLT